MITMQCLPTLGLSLLASLGLTGCPGPSDPEPVLGQPTRSDSAGIAIILNAPALSAPLVVEFADSADLDIGGIHDDPEQELSPRLSHAFLRLSTGEVAVSDGFDVHLYTREGDFIRSFGRQGEGPGEFQSIIWTLCELEPDTLLVLEVPSPRIGRISLTTRELTTVTYVGRTFTTSCLPDGFLARTSPPTYDSPGTPAADYTVVNGAGEVVRKVGTMPSEHYRTFFSRAELLAGRSDGSVIAAEGPTFEHRQYSPGGRLRRIVRTKDIVDSLTASEAGEILARRLGQDVPPARRRALEDQALGTAARLAVPAYHRMNVDEAGRVWLAGPRLVAGQLETWTVFDSTGSLLGRADPNLLPDLPRGRRLLLKWTSAEVVVGYYDEDGAFHVRATPYRLINRP